MLNNEIIIILNNNVSKKKDVNNLFKNFNYKEIVELTDSYSTKDYNNKNFKRIIKMILNKSNKNIVINTINELKQLDCVYCAEPNYYYNNCSLPNDYTSSPSIQYSIEKLDLEKAWNIKQLVMKM